ncbi:MAG: hypothetical protein IT385_26280 [Deltaproteobacteria bacterium]|nr:hypothetical protein [Deltaproteobacteria bacterium]
MSSPHASLSVLAGLLVACGGGSEGNPWVPVLRAGVDIVYDGPRMEGYAVLSTSIPSLDVQDVHHDGAGWIVVVNERWSSVAVWHIPSACTDCMGTVGSAGGGNLFPVRVSADGAGWTPFQPDVSSWTGGAILGTWRTGAGGPYEESLLIGMSSHAGIGGRQYPDWRAMRADFGGDRLVADALYDGRPLYKPMGRSGGGAYLGGIDASGPDYMGGAWVRDGVHDWSFPLNEPSGQWDLRWMPRSMDFRSVDGLVYGAFGPGRDPAELCWWTLRMDGDELADHRPVTICTQASLLPAGFTGTAQTETVTHVASRGVTWFSTEPGHQGDAHAAWIVADGASGSVRSADLGPGVPDKDRLTPVHPRFGTWLELRTTDGALRYVDVLADGTAVELALPDEGPCENACPHSLRWLEPLGDDEYMAFWVVVDESAATHELVVSQRIRATTRPVGDEGPVDPGESPVPKYPSAVPAGPLEAACHAVYACWPRTRWDTCLGYWQSFPADAPAVQRFIGAVGSGCEAIRQAWGAPATIGGDCNQGRCVGDVLLTKCTQGGLGGQVMDAVDCGVLGTTCSTEGMAAGTGACVDGSVAGSALECNTCTPAGGAVHCWAPGGNQFPIVEDCASQGLGCAGRFGQIWCVPETCTEESEPMRCEGDVVRACDGAGFVSEMDCGLYGVPCQTMPSGLDVGCDHTMVERDCLVHALGATCAGDHLVFCAGDDVKWIDCLALGMSGCAGDACTP